MESVLLKEGLIVMVIGMGTVFVFLTILVGVMYLSSYVLKLINEYFPEEVLQEKIKFEDDIAVAIACAVSARGM